MNCIKGGMFFKSRILESIASLQSDYTFIHELWQCPPVQTHMIGHPRHHERVINY